MCVNSASGFDNKSNLALNPAFLIRKPDPGDRRLQRLYILFQCMYPGSPMLYYGDEAGMWGGDDPDCRKPMLWPDFQYQEECSEGVNGDSERYENRFDSTIFRYYAGVLAMREKNIALKSGTIRTILLDDERRLYGFVRQAGANRVYILFNASTQNQDCDIRLADVPEGVRVFAPLQKLSYFVERDGLHLTIPPRTGIVLIPAM